MVIVLDIRGLDFMLLHVLTSQVMTHQLLLPTGISTR